MCCKSTVDKAVFPAELCSLVSTQHCSRMSVHRCGTHLTKLVLVQQVETGPYLHDEILGSLDAETIRTSSRDAVPSMHPAPPARPTAASPLHQPSVSSPQAAHNTSSGEWEAGIWKVRHRSKMVFQRDSITQAVGLSRQPYKRQKCRDPMYRLHWGFAACRVTI